jgi:hypothetical protein
MVLLQRNSDPDFPNWIAFISSEYRIPAANVLHYHDRLCYNNVRQAYQRNSLSLVKILGWKEPSSKEKENNYAQTKRL